MSMLSPIDLNNWCFKHASPASPLELAHEIVTCSSEIWGGVQSAIQHRLKNDPNVKALNKARPKASETPHFGKYRKDKWYNRYHCAFRAVAAGTAAHDQHEMADGLKGEIERSSIILPTGQVLFHGRADRLIEKAPYPTVISTSLDASIARSHAWKRHWADQTLRATIYLLTLAEPLPAIWGQYGNVYEYELVLPPNLTISAQSTHTTGDYLLVEATISR